MHGRGIANIPEIALAIRMVRAQAGAASSAGGGAHTGSATAAVAAFAAAAERAPSPTAEEEKAALAAATSFFSAVSTAAAKANESEHGGFAYHYDGRVELPGGQEVFKVLVSNLSQPGETVRWRYVWRGIILHEELLRTGDVLFSFQRSLGMAPYLSSDERLKPRNWVRHGFPGCVGGKTTAQLIVVGEAGAFHACQALAQPQ